MKKYRFIVSGGGTGGHIFPALSIADGLKHQYPDCEILFVGAEGKMEMEKVPAAGYRIIGLPVAGFHRGEIWRNLMFLPKLIRSLLKAGSIVSSFKPDLVVGVGGYASGPLLRSAIRKNIPAVLQEQNSYAGVTNKILGKKAEKICVAYDHMDRFFPAGKIVFTGNPIRKGLEKIEPKNQEALQYFKVNPEQKIVLVVGGSLGARTLNDSVLANLESIRKNNVVFIWQTGKFYYQQIANQLAGEPNDNIRLMEFIPRMDLAYAVADVVISRAGAGTISELCMVGIASILVPSPNVAEDHQTRNAMALVEKDAALLVQDSKAKSELIVQAFNLVENNEKCTLLGTNIKKMATPNATEDIIKVISTILEAKHD